MKKRLMVVVMLMAICVSMLAGCGGGKKEENEVAKITWYLSGIKNDSSYDSVFEEVNKLLKERYKMALDIVLIDGSNFGQKIQMMNASRETYDLAFTSNWMNNYYSNVTNGCLKDITEMLPKYAPNLYKSIDPDVLKAVSIDNKVYAVPNWQVQARATGLFIPKDKLAKTGMSLDDFTALEDITPYLKKINTIEPTANKISDFWGSAMAYYGMLYVGYEGTPGVFYYNHAGKPIVVNQFDTPEFKEYIKMRRAWVKSGLCTDVYQTKDFIAKEMQQAPFLVFSYKPGIEAEFSKNKGYDWVAKQFSTQILGADTLLSTMTGISQTSEQPEKALELLEILYNDKEIYNMLSWGLEGKNYNKDANGKITVAEGNTYSMSNWAIGSVANSYILATQDDNIWDQTKTFNNSAIKSPLLGFTLSIDESTGELSNCQKVLDEQYNLLSLGLVEDVDKALEKLNSDLKQAGIDTLIARMQEQVDKWSAKK